jgi:copper chaperone CopZ
VKTTIIEVPNLYGDHHVIEIRRILLAIPGVLKVNASSAFRMVEVTFDPSQTNDLDISVKLDEAGYLSEWTVPIELSASVEPGDSAKPFFRHTAVYENMRQVVSFAQNVARQQPGYLGRPLWNCPGMGVIRKMEE